MEDLKALVISIAGSIPQKETLMGFKGTGAKAPKPSLIELYQKGRGLCNIL